VTAFVLDASVTMRWFFEAGKHPHADAILHGLMSATDTAAVPILWRYEISSVLARARLRDGLPAQEAANFIANLEALPIVVDDESARRILTDVQQLAVTYRLTSYDAAYLELALRRNLPLATLDADLIAACGSAGVQVR
jgi:predicted nucleic acid-binding protein